MAEMTPQQQNLLRYLVPLLQAKESAQAAVGPSALGTVLDMILPSSQTVEKMSYGDMPFRMPTQSRIPITTDKQYLADLIGVAGALTPAAKPVQRGVQQLVREIQTTVPRGQVRLPQQPVMQTATPKAPPVSGLLEPVKSDIGFYSQLEAATIPLQNKGTGEQYLAQISKTQGVKPEELQWTGLDEFLKSRQSVTKAEIQDYLNANRVNVQEVRLEQTNKPIRLSNEELARLNVLQEKERAEGLGGLEAEEYSDLFNKQIAFEEFVDKTQFSKYTLPGGENYREILLTLPAKQLTEAEAKVVLGAAPDAKLSSADIAYASRKNVNEYISSHFDQPNILAHMRVNDRVVDGKKTLFIEEIQSDWHQAGRKKGYQQQTRPVSEIQKELDSLVTELRSKPGVSYAPSEEDWARYPEITSKYDALQSEWKEASKQKTRDAVPDAPFKTSWHELTLKRAIQEASEKGYDQIAFTTGKTQAERYDLSKQIKTLIYSEPDAQGLRKVEAITPSGDRLLGKRYTLNEIEDNVGKEVAEKISKSSGEFDQRTGTYAMSGLDLQVGGEGMKGFYDNILPKSLEKLGKKFDAKVTKSRLPSTQNKDDLTEKVYGRGELYYRLPSELKSKIDQMYLERGIEVWTMDITPKMRESVTTKGQPLFAVPAIGAGLLGASMYQDEPMY